MWPPDLANLHVLRPLWLAAIPLALAIAVLVARRAPARSRWYDVIDPGLREAMLDRGDRGSSVVLALAIGTALTLACIILAGPAWQRLPQPVVQREDALVIVLDLSLSMYATDLEPSRLVHARHKIVDLLRTRREGQTALVVYAGDAHVVVPLTDDTATIENLLPALSPAIMPALGSQVGQGIDLARALLRSAGIAHGRILLVTDGIDRLGDVTERCGAHGSTLLPSGVASAPSIAILGVGTPDGAPIPLAFADQPGNFLTDRSGRRVIPRLDDDRLREAASLCGGTYARITAGDADLDALLPKTLNLEPIDDDSQRTFDQWVDAGQYFVLALVPFALLAFRRGVVLALLLMVVHPADASLWDDLWQRRDQQGYEALRRGEPERASRLFDAPQWQGIARYRSGNFEGAEERFREDAGASGHYNRGNALARQGRLEDAIAAYDDALRLAPDDDDARFNKALIEQLLEQQAQAEGQGNQSAPDRADREPTPGSSEGDRSQGNESDGEASTPGPEESDASEAEPQDAADARADDQLASEETQTPRDEQEEALDRWLRRIPDDPGGLLRRKFQYETNQRMRQGQYPPREERIW